MSGFPKSETCMRCNGVGAIRHPLAMRTWTTCHPCEGTGRRRRLSSPPVQISLLPGVR